MFKKDIGYLFAILKMCDDLEIYKNDYKNDLDKLLNSRIGLNACLMNISQIGEYCGKLTDEFKVHYDNVEWQKIKNLRNVIIHDYMGVDKDKIEKLLMENIPKLINELLQIINDLLRKNIIDNNLLEASSKDFSVINIKN